MKEMLKNSSSPSGNRTLVSRVTGGDTDHYTNEDCLSDEVNTMNLFTHRRNVPSQKQPSPGSNGAVAWLDEPTFPHNKLSRSVNGERQTSTENG